MKFNSTNCAHNFLQMSLNTDPLLQQSEDERVAVQEIGIGDKPNPQKLLFFLLGNASLFAFNILINAIDIFFAKTGKESISTDLNRAYNIPCSIMALILCIFKPSNYKYALIIALGVLSVLMICLGLAILVSNGPSFLYPASLTISCLIGVFSSLCFSSSNSFASQFGPEATAAVSSGNGCCGVIAAALRILTKAVTKEGNKSEVFINAAYFFLSAVVFIATLIYFLVKLRDYSVASKVRSDPNEPKHSVFSKTTLDVIKIIYPQWLSIFFNFCITLSIFPGYLTGVKSPSYLGSWTPVIVTTLFCVFDWIGRAIPGYWIWPKMKYAWIPVVVRIVYYLIFMLSIQQVVNLGDPWWTFAWMIPFAVSNGMAGTVQVIYGANHEDLTFEQRRYAGLLVSFAVNAGILFAMIVTLIIPTPPK